MDIHCEDTRDEQISLHHLDLSLHVACCGSLLCSYNSQHTAYRLHTHLLKSVAGWVGFVVQTLGDVAMLVNITDWDKLHTTILWPRMLIWCCNNIVIENRKSNAFKVINETEIQKKILSGWCQTKDQNELFHYRDSFRTHEPK